MHNELSLNNQWLFVGVGYNATNKMRLSGMQSGHKLTQLDKIDRRYRFGSTSFLLLFALVLLWGIRLTRMVFPQMNKQLIRRPLQNINNSVIDRILVLFQPCSDVVGYSASIVDASKVSIFVSL